MSESLFPFRDVEEPAPAPAPAGAGGENRRALVLLGGGLAVAAGVAAAVLLVGGGGEDDLSALVPASGPAPVAAAAAPAPSPSATTVPVQNTESFARNPFKAQYVEPPPPAVPSPVSVTVPLAPGATPLDLSLGGTVPPPPGSGATPAPTAPPPAPAEYPITLESVGEPRGDVRLVTWTLDGKPVETVPGQRFGRLGELVVLAYVTDEGSPAVTGVLLQVGDANPFRFTVGETVKVL